MRISDWISDVCSSDLCGGFASRQSFHRPAAGEVLFTGGKGPKTPCAGRTQAQLLLRLCPALLAECGPAPTRASMPSNKGAFLPHSAAMLGVLYGAFSHSARASIRYSSAFQFHPTTSDLKITRLNSIHLFASLFPSSPLNHYFFFFLFFFSLFFFFFFF